MRPLRLLHKGLPRICTENLLKSMTVITDLASLEAVSAVPSGAVFILGHFDGVHLGHRSLFDEARRMIRDRSEDSGSAPAAVVWTLSGLDKGGCLTTEAEKLRLFRRLGADYALSDAFSDIRDLDGESFFRQRIASASPSGLICGYNFTFGRGAAWRAEDLSRMASEAGIPCAVVPPCSVGGEPVSSTGIRKRVLAGDLDGAAQMLGRPYFVSGTVRHGKRIGHTIGFPTLNLRLPPCKVSPPRGVYASVVRWEENGSARLAAGVSNLGSRPTVNGDRDDVTLETNVFADPGDLYGAEITVWLLRFLRPEKKFGSVDGLQEAIALDREEARRAADTLWSRYEDEFYL
ncbi:MAG: hypothetical protein E7576_11170 [Ruminococcaceae bacterium]|nr:hypothetical protein [Oscillospiraceae bacterium]